MTPLLIGGGGGGEDGGGEESGRGVSSGSADGRRAVGGTSGGAGSEEPQRVAAVVGTEPGAFILVGLGLVFNGSPYYLPTGGDVLLEVALGRTTVHAAPASVQTGVGIALRVARGIGEMDAELTTNPAW